MLVLTRHLGEEIVITVPPSQEERTIEVTLIEIRGPKKARIGIEADASVAVHRREVQDRVDSGEERKECVMTLDWCNAEIRVLKRELSDLRALVLGDGLANKVFDLTRQLVQVVEENARLKRGEFTPQELAALDRVFADRRSA